VTLARDGRKDGAPCPTVEGLWLSTNLETALDMRATGMPGRLDVRAVGSDWTGGAESLFGDRGPVTAIVSQPATGTTVTFVGHCRASHGVDTMTGAYTIFLVGCDLGERVRVGGLAFGSVGELIN